MICQSGEGENLGGLIDREEEAKAEVAAEPESERAMNRFVETEFKAGEAEALGAIEATSLELTPADEGAAVRGVAIDALDGERGGQSAVAEFAQQLGFGQVTRAGGFA